MDAVDVSRFANVTVWFYVSGAATVNDILLEASPDNGTTFWKEINASQCDNTATLDACILNNIGHFTWLRAEARASANSATKVFISGFRP